MAQKFCELNFTENENWLTIVPSIFIAIAYKLTQNIAFYTFIQAFAFIFTSSLVIYKIEKSFVVPLILYWLCPIFMQYSVFWAPSVGCTIGINLLLLFLIYYKEKMQDKNYTKLDGWFFFIGSSFAYFIILGYRQNAFTIIPVILYLFMKVINKRKRKIFILINLTSFCLTLIFVNSIPKILRFNTIYDTSSVGFMWETISMLDKLKNNPKYIGYLDGIGEVGDTELAINSNNLDNVHGFSKNLSYVKSGSKENALFIKKRYLNLLFNEPTVFLKTKIEFAKRTLGINYTLVNGEYDYNRWEKMDEFGFSDTSLRKDFHSFFNNVFFKFILARKPYLCFMLTGILLLLHKIKCRNEKQELLNGMFVLSIFYYGAFLITTQSHEFRYFFPSFHLLTITFVICLFNIIKSYFITGRRSLCLTK